MDSRQLGDDIDESCLIQCKVIDNPNSIITEINNIKTNNNIQLNIISANIRSVNKNLDNFLVYATRLQTNLDIIVLSECWCDDASTPPQIDGYDMYFTKRSFNQNDGVIMYIHNNHVAAVLEIEIDEANCLAAKIDDMTIIGIYRPFAFKNPLKFIDSLDTFLTTTKTRNIVLAGDINIDTLNLTCANVREYLEIIGSHGLIDVIDTPTHGNTCLDHFMCKLSTTSQ
jgi:exonuclease III